MIFVDIKAIEYVRQAAICLVLAVQPRISFIYSSTCTHSLAMSVSSRSFTNWAVVIVLGVHWHRGSISQGVPIR